MKRVLSVLGAMLVVALSTVVGTAAAGGLLSPTQTIDQTAAAGAVSVNASPNVAALNGGSVKQSSGSTATADASNTSTSSQGIHQSQTATQTGPAGCCGSEGDPAISRSQDAANSIDRTAKAGALSVTRRRTRLWATTAPSASRAARRRPRAPRTRARPTRAAARARPRARRRTTAAGRVTARPATGSDTSSPATGEGGDEEALAATSGRPAEGRRPPAPTSLVRVRPRAVTRKGEERPDPHPYGPRASRDERRRCGSTSGPRERAERGWRWAGDRGGRVGSTSARAG